MSMAEDTVVPLGHLVFIQSKSGISKIELTKKLSDALEVLGIQRYILLIDVYVDEILGRRPTTSIATSASTDRETGSFKKSRVRFPIFEPFSRSNGIPLKKFLKSFGSEETNIQFQILQAYVDRISRVHCNNPWVLLVECSFQTRFDYAGLQLLSDKFNFSIHWLPNGTKKDQNTKFQSIVVQILTKGNETKKQKSKSKLADGCETNDIQTLHQNLEAYDQKQNKNPSCCTFDSYDIVLNSPPFFTNSQGKRTSGNTSSTSFISSAGSSESSDSEIDLEDERLEIALDISKKLPFPNLEKYIEISEGNPENNIKHQKSVIVVLVRDIFSGPASHLSLMLKEALRRHGIKSKRLAVSTLFVQPTTISLMKNFANRDCTDADFTTNLSRGCTSLLLTILHFKVSQEMREPTVIIVDLENEKYIRMFTVLNFCIKVGLKVLMLEKRPDGTFERNFRRVYTELKKCCMPAPGRSLKIRKLKLPKFNLTFVKEFLPLESCTDFVDGDEKLSTTVSSDLSVRVPSDSALNSESVCLISTTFDSSSPSTDKVPTVQLVKSKSSSFPTTPLVTSSKTRKFGSQILEFIFQKKSSQTLFTFQNRIKGTFGVSILESIFKRRNPIGFIPQVIKLSNVNEKDKPVNNDDVLPEINDDALPVNNDDVLSEINDDVLPEINDVLPEINDDVLTEINDDVLPEINDDVLPEINDDVLPEINDVLSENMDMEKDSVTDENLNELLDPKSNNSSDFSFGAGIVMKNKVSNLLTNGNPISIKSEISDPTSSSEALIHKKILNFPLPGEVCYEPKSYNSLPQTQVVCHPEYHRPSLIEICRLPQKKRRRIEKLRDPSEGSDDSLFKGWVGMVRKDHSKVKQKKKGIFSRLLNSIQLGLRNFIIGPIRNAFRTNPTRVMPSQIRRDWKNVSGSHKVPYRRRRSMRIMPAEYQIKIKSPK